MDLLDFFDLSKEFKKVIVPGSQTQGHVQVNKEELFHDPYNYKRTDKGQDYAKEYQLKEEDEMAKILQNRTSTQDVNSEPGVSNMYDVDDLTSVGAVPNIDELSWEDRIQVYKNYDFNCHPDNPLPINLEKKKIVSYIETQDVTVIQGATGCGKTTQVPQFILDHYFERNAPCNIIITQPRRIAAITVAKRVSQERNWPLGTVVGYQVGLINKTSPDTRLTYCTTGVLLQKFINSKNMNTYSHVILDEVHERDQDTDFALLIVRKLLRTNSRNVKVILMSATFNIDRFASYFSVVNNNKLEPASKIEVDKGNERSSFAINIFYLNELQVLGQLPDIRLEEPGVTERGYEVAVKLISQFDGLEERGNKTRKGAVLVFLPGIYEIEELYNQLIKTAQKAGHKWWIRPLHSTITIEEQESVFRPPSSGQRKIILSTNIAESSVTVPDIVYVIDFCLTKHLICDQTTNFTSLQVCWASKANCTQRAGRSGRVAEGRVYRLVPEEFYDVLEDEGTPEILRCPLERLVLQAKLFDMGEPKALLALALDPPNLTNLENTIHLLKEAGALLLDSHGQESVHDGDITFMGRVMAMLPVDIHISKLIVLGHIFSVLEECIIMGAAMSLKSVFSAPFQERLNAYNSKLTWADSSCSDCISFLNAYMVWCQNRESGFYERSAGGGEKAWARRYHIQLRTMKEVHVLVQELTQRLKKVGITSIRSHGRIVWSHVEKPLVMKVVIAGAFYPNYFVRGAHGGQIDEREAVKLLVGRDPFNTVFFQGMPTDQPGELYAKTVKKYLKDCSEDVKVSVDGTSKVYAEFGRSKIREAGRNMFNAEIPGRVSMAVYKAVKLRQLKIPCTLHLLKPSDAALRVEQLGLCSNKEKESTDDQQQRMDPTLNPNLPTIDVSYVHIQLTHIIDPGHFWASSVDTSSAEIQSWLFNKLNGTHEILEPVESPEVGKIYVAPYMDYTGSKYYRASVEAIHPKKGKENVLEAFFIDYGNIESVKASELRDIKDEALKAEILGTPPQAFECILSEVQPSLISNSRGLWTEEAEAEFRNLVKDKAFYGQVYSVVNGVVSLELILQSRLRGQQLNVNHWLIEKGFGQRAEESYLSKLNHDLRMEQANMDPDSRRINEVSHLSSKGHLDQDILEPPTKNECRMQVTLRGPTSPLEMKVYNLTLAGVRREVTIEWNSVNSVLLDSEPQDPHERLLVAASVGQNPQGDRLTLRHTTLMPNIHGLAALIPLIFAPFIELRTNISKTKFTGALCGLGYDGKGCSLFPDHDMEISFDTNITLSDLENINKLRYWMNNALYTEDYQDIPDVGPRDIIKCQRKIKEFLFALLKKKRKPQEITLIRKQYCWNLLNEEDLLNPTNEEAEDRRVIFRLHWGVSLVEEDKSEMEEMIKHTKDLQMKALSSEPVKEILCRLCQVLLQSCQALRLHLQTAQHRDREAELTRAQN